jgi:ATP/maltotriose-dependent transcriptional regulator MalT
VLEVLPHPADRRTGCRILAQAEGWIVAILLALRSENLAMEIPKVLGAREHVYTYLAEEVIHSLPQS